MRYAPIDLDSHLSLLPLPCQASHQRSGDTAVCCHHDFPRRTAVGMSKDCDVEFRGSDACALRSDCATFLWLLGDQSRVLIHCDADMCK